MRAISILLFFVITTVSVNRSMAQCPATSAVVSDFSANTSTGEVSYRFNWQYLRANPSIQVIFLWNGAPIGSPTCLSNLRDSTGGLHTVTGTISTSSIGTLRIEVRIWSNPDCSGISCTDFREVSQSSLPVQFKTFGAVRHHSNVNLKWEMIWEQNSAGFAVQRNTTGTWEQVGYVPTLAPGGTSANLMTYEYTDVNTNRGASQYRIRQIDIDNRSKFSETRLVGGDKELADLVVYPNPAIDGKVNVSFENTSIKDISVADMSGRMVRQWKGITGNNVIVENLSPGMYTLRVTDPVTGYNAMAKIMINQR